eukprot:6068423-Alexandrium_andersonii.AAC.1
MDGSLQSAQYGCRKQKGIADAMQYIGRMIDKGASTQTKTLLVLLGWEKALDNMLHHKIFPGLRRLGVPDKIVE